MFLLCFSDSTELVGFLEGDSNVSLWFGSNVLLVLAWYAICDDNDSTVKRGDEDGIGEERDAIL